MLHPAASRAPLRSSKIMIELTTPDAVAHDLAVAHGRIGLLAHASDE